MSSYRSYGAGYNNNRGGGGGGYHRNNTPTPKPPANLTVKSDFYTGVNVRSDYSEQDITVFREKEGITIRGSNVPPPIMEFTDYPWPKSISAGFSRQGYDKPTPIQAQGWPIALAGRDMVGIAQTGSGKTMSYIIPAFIHIDSQLNERRDYGPMALVLAPTRELAQQIQEVVNHFQTRFGNVCVFGGASKGPQIKEITRNRPMLVIATPGRLNDFIESGIISLANISYLVLDEADRMLDMGFEPQIRKIIATITMAKRQTLMWSATWPKEVRTLAEEFLQDYIQINVGALQLHANHNITQIVEVCGDMEKKEKLFSLLTEIVKENSENKIIVFAETKRKVDDLTKQLRYSNWPAMCIHGDKSQSERDWVLKEFRSGKAPILVATDVAARGLDVEDIKYVINFDYPNSSEDYVHRIGRTGRKNKKGTAYTFFTKGNSKQANDLINVLKEANQTVNPKLLELSRFGGGPDKYRRYGSSRNGFIPKNSYNSGRGGGGNGYNNSYGNNSNGNGAGYPQKRKFDSFDAASNSNAKKPYYDSSYSSGSRFN
ncbi:ATP-dependent RNA helicase dbp2 [Tetranychus urticae]|uniref:RNA helicase n=1 Tax=Tetranychus urticae TaxID=32264 RepID=T1JRZ5_TETUR|nr:ATP-dependent RNA helicase dbp2 [Tetranychus urticae]